MTTTNGDLFPPADRVIYGKPVLLQVVCQVRFPTVLRIETEAPAAFQDKIRHVFPLLERANPLFHQFPPEMLPPEMLQAVSRQGALTAYQFLTEDRMRTVELTPTSLGLTLANYTRWEDLLSCFRLPLSALVAEYAPSFLSRIGVRYIDFIDRAKLGLMNVAWSNLLRPEILGEMARPEIERSVLSANRVLHIRLSDGASVVLRHGLGTAQGAAEKGYLIDLDFSTEQRTEVSDAERILENLHHGVGRAFRWCITDQLHRAMEPDQLTDNDGASSRYDAS
jgi:uncharacterized protein (TIGR04255 family)